VGSAAIVLDKITQTGRDFEAQMLVAGGFDPLSIKGVSAEVTTMGSSGEGSTFGLGAAGVRTRINGFTVFGQLEAADQRVVFVRLTSIQLAVAAEPAWRVDVSPVWPVAAREEPKALRLNQARRIGAGDVRLRTILSWADRLEAVFELHGLADTPQSRFDLGRIFLIVEAAPGASQIGQGVDASLERWSAGQLIARFETVTPRASTVVIRAELLRFLSGPWQWEVH
jgi:hypothetical protein